MELEAEFFIEYAGLAVDGVHLFMFRWDFRRVERILRLHPTAAMTEHV